MASQAAGAQVCRRAPARHHPRAWGEIELKKRTSTTALEHVHHQRPLIAAALAVFLYLTSAAAIPVAVMLGIRSRTGMSGNLPYILVGVLIAGLGGIVGRGLWKMQNWARTALMLVLLTLLLVIFLSALLRVSAEIFGGEQVMGIQDILHSLVGASYRSLGLAAAPAMVLFLLYHNGSAFTENPQQRQNLDRRVRSLLAASGLSAVLIVLLIMVFTLNEAWPAVQEIGLGKMLLGTIWRPGSIIGAEGAQFGLVPMIIGSVLATFGAVVIGVPLSILTAILLAETAPPLVREIVRPAIELLAGIPSVVYGLFGMVVLAPLIRLIPVPRNNGFGLLNASIILAVMIMPTVTNIAEDAIRAVPRAYKEGSLALGATHWQTIWSVILPTARSGLVAAVILGVGRALGETMALIMVIGNSIAIPEPLTANPLTLFLSTARTLTGNIAVEINYAAGAHRSALFFTGVLLFLMIMLVNSFARFLMRGRKK